MKSRFFIVNKAAYVAVFFALVCFYLLSFPGNRSENDDGYFYAYAIRSYDYVSILFPRYLLFLPTFKGLLSLVQWFMPSADAYLLMCMVSAIASAISVLLFYFLLKTYFQLSTVLARLCAISFMCSYGYWRYAVEAEVYTVSLLFCLLTVFAACVSMANGFHWKPLMMTALLAAISVLWYKPAGVVVLVAVPVYFLLQKIAAVQIAAWSILVAVIVLCVYAVAFQFNETNISFWQYINSGIEQSPGHVLNALPVVSSNVVSLNFIYAFPPVVQLIEQWFPGKQLVEEVYTAKQHASLALLAACTGALFFSLALFVIWQIRRSISLHGFLKNPFSLWLVMYTIALLIVDPGSPEPWLMIQPALFAVFGIYFFPLIVKHTSKQLLYALVIVLCLHNFVGGYLFIKNPNEDYTRFQSAWLINNATEKDMVISLGSASAVRYLLYYGQAKVFTGEQQFAQAMLAAKQVHQQGGKIYLTDDFVHPSATVQRRNAAAFSLVKNMLQQQQANIHLLHPQEATAAAVYLWKPQ
ncbi:hypothetical protein [Phnomibacter sp. MR]|uniref:hypothetical protein n=1 Tax=Phnomibacter sp. MR TaxID=3042318 RepID=UPI003A7FDEC4